MELPPDLSEIIWLIWCFELYAFQPAETLKSLWGHISDYDNLADATRSVANSLLEHTVVIDADVTDLNALYSFCKRHYDFHKAVLRNSSKKITTYR
jgi:hypothetical protein